MANMRVARFLPTPSRGMVFAFLLLAITALGLRRFGIWFLVAPPSALAGILLGHQLFRNPILVLCLFLVVAVNLDFFRFGDILSADILTSSFLMYLLMVRLGLQRQKLFTTPLERIYAVYLLATIISVLLSINPVLSIKNWFRDFEYLLLITFIFALEPTEGQKRTIVGAVLLASIIPCVVGLAGIIFGIDRFYGNIAPLETGQMVLRVQSTLTHPATFAQFLFTMSILTLAMILDGRWFRKAYLVPLFLVQIYLLYLGYSRVMWGEFLIGLCILLWLFRHRRFLFLGLPASILTLVFLVPTFLSRWSTAVEQSKENSLLIRLAIWLKALSLVPKRPIFGSGPDTFVDYVGFRQYGAHNTWVNMLVETGVVGLVLYVAVIVAVWRALLVRVRTASGQRPDVLVAAVYAIFVPYFIASWFTAAFEVPQVNVYFWTLLPLALFQPASRVTEAEPKG
jgi:putative inorganic carbon (HCO3(-)) transporter